MADFPPHNPDFPDVDPASGDEQETTGPSSADARRLGELELEVES